MNRRIFLMLSAAGALAGGLVMSFGQEPEELAVEHAECSYFGPKRAQFLEAGLNASRRNRIAFSEVTEDVLRQMPAVQTFVPAGSRTSGQQKGSNSGNVVDRNIFGVLQAQGIQPAARSTDYEFVRRVSLDLTGRVPAPEKVQEFVANPDPEKRANYIDELLASPEWVDKWTMFFGDLYRNTDTIRATNTLRRAEGREAFYLWIKNSLAGNKPYNQMAFELISAAGTNSWAQGELNWHVGNRTTGGPVQDNYDQMASSTMETFLGNAHFNCIMCHNGRGHVDTLSLWGKGASRMQAYGFAAFFAQTTLAQQPAAQRPDPNIYYWLVNTNRNATYQLNTTTGNRPARQPIGTVRAVTPEYPFGNGGGASASSTWSVAAAKYVTEDFNFSRATVNYIWKEMMVKGLVEPVNQMDPARLDPDDPPPAPWTLQPTNARLLKELAQDFIDNGYNLKQLMRRIATSDAYQLSARYEGEWNPQWESLHARRLVKRLWPEEIYDAIVQTSNVPAPISMTVETRIPNGPVPAPRIVQWAMQTTSPASRGGAAAFLNPFYPGDREDTERRRDGSDIQALTLMNNNFVLTRTRSSATNGQNSVLRQHINKTDRELVEILYLTVLSRPPGEGERSAALAALTSGNRTQAAENLLWALYNKVDFFFNY